MYRMLFALFGSILNPTDSINGKVYRSNPELKTIIASSAWKGTPVDKSGRFVNLEHPFVPSLLQVMRWKLQTNTFRAQKKKEHWVPDVLKDPSWINSKEDVMVWLGHSTFFIRIGGVQILTDPVFGNILAVKRKSVLPVDPKLFRQLDYILISHDHRDHLDRKSLKLLSSNNPSVKYLAGLGLEKIIKQMTGSKSIEAAGWYQQYSTAEQKLKITFIPSRHWSKRGLFDTNKRLWGGFVIESAGKRILFAGDSGYDGHYRQISQVFGAIDYAILGIGAYEPSWFMRPNHQSPSEALQAFTDLKARSFIPMHYGTFDLSNEPMSLPVQDLSKAAKTKNLTNQLVKLKIGGILSL